MDVPKWEDKTPKSNKVEDGRLVRPLEQAGRFSKQVQAVIKSFRSHLKQGRTPFDTKVDVRWTPKEDKDARQE